MSTTTANASDEKAGPAPSKRRIWGWGQYLALAAIPILLLEAWTLARWAAAGPHLMSDYWSAVWSPDWWKARIIEVGSVGVAVWVCRHLYRDFRVQGKFLTFDVMFCITGATTFWASGGINFFQPMFSYSSNLISINDPCSFIPGVVNPDCGRIPNPFFVTILEGFMVLAVVIIVGRAVDRIRARNPHISRSRLCWYIIGLCCAFVVLEPVAIIPLKGWVWPGTPLSLFGGTYRYPVFPEILCFAGYLAVPAFVRIFKDDKGRTVLERHMEHYHPRKRTAITFLGLYTIMQFTVWGPGTAPLWILGFHQQEWVQLPPHLNNGLCDQPGVSSRTVYGPCPGSQGYRMPLHGQPGTPTAHA
jgi:hypothetical protein